jgi:hypothetical protein
MSVSVHCVYELIGIYLCAFVATIYSNNTGVLGPFKFITTLMSAQYWLLRSILSQKDPLQTMVFCFFFKDSF